MGTASQIGTCCTASCRRSPRQWHHPLLCPQRMCTTACTLSLQWWLLSTRVAEAVPRSVAEPRHSSLPYTLLPLLSFSCLRPSPAVSSASLPPSLPHVLCQEVHHPARPPAHSTLSQTAAIAFTLTQPQCLYPRPLPYLYLFHTVPALTSPLTFATLGMVSFHLPSSLVFLLA